MAIEFDGDFTVPTSQDDAFAVFSEMGRFAPLLPTYKSHEIREDGSADVSVKVGVGKVRGTAKVNLTREECHAPVRAKYVGKGSVMGGVFNLIAEFDLENAGRGETRVNWHGELLMFGKLVSLAGGMIKPVAQRDIANLIEAVRLALGGAEAEVIEEPPGWFTKLLSRIRGWFRRGDRKEGQ